MLATPYSFRKHLLVAVVGMIGLTGMAPNAPAQCQFPKLTASDAAGIDQFGTSVAVSGDSAVIGAPFDNDPRSGSAYLFEKVADAWTQTTKLLAADGAWMAQFGVSVAISGDTAVIGANDDDARRGVSGSAYVFEKVAGVWTQVAKLTASDRALGDRFGTSVAVSGDTVVIGAHRDDDNGTDSGSAYVFAKVAGVWTQTVKLAAEEGATGDSFGRSVAVSGDTVVIGANGDDDLGYGSGSAYVFERFGGVWTQTGRIAAADGAGGDSFGGSVAVSGNTVVIGASGDDDRGSAYVFEKVGGAWTQTAKLTAADRGRDSFGKSVAISGNTAVIGAYRDDDGCSLGITPCDSGSAYVFKKLAGVWTQTAKLTASDGARFDYFGRSVALSGDTAVTGAHRDDDACPGDLNCDSGSAYVFALSPPVVDTDGDGILDVCDPCPLDNPDDSDADGVCQSVDACPDTPLGVPINECGCLEAGACCTLTGKCSKFTRDACAAFGGIYQGDGSVCANGCAFGDLDGDGDVDLVDFGVFTRCFTGEEGEAGPACSEADVDGCGPIDLDDFTAFRAALTGP